jgi:hypothetical protein
MNWLEIIDVCSAGPRERIKILELCGKIRVPRLRGRSANLKVYGSSLSNELSIHIQWTSYPELEGKSPLGRALSRTIGDLGLVTHSIWMECNQSMPGKTA